MKRIFVLLGALLLVSAVWPAAVSGQQVGDSATIIVPTGKITNLRQVLIVKGPPKATATKVGNCGSGGVHFQDAELVDRDAPPGRGGRGSAASPEKIPTVATEVAVIMPGAAGFKEFKSGWQVGSYRTGGKCGPGYDIYVGHIIAMK
ncbi:MAG: hypothetical protein HYS05_06175 [Acidobacteria bacterium]|nr:hypothetical protein [Acidobacteriota bacterium]